jgi:hypothetical protein
MNTSFMRVLSDLCTSYKRLTVLNVSIVINAQPLRCFLSVNTCVYSKYSEEAVLKHMALLRTQYCRLIKPFEFLSSLDSFIQNIYCKNGSHNFLLPRFRSLCFPRKFSLIIDFAVSSYVNQP